MPVFGRLPLVKYTIERLLKKNKVDQVICIVSTAEDRDALKDSGAITYAHPNKPLGAKWNLAFQHAKEHDPDACLFVGSGDWLSDNWVEVMSRQMERPSSDMIGKPDFYLLDIQTKTGLVRACYWAGYDNERYGESIGIGRMLSRRILDKIDWSPFDPRLDKNMDYSMVQRVTVLGANITLYEDNGETKSLSLSCDQWGNKHQFEDHWTNRLKSQRIDAQAIVEEFPESMLIFPEMPAYKPGRRAGD